MDADTRSELGSRGALKFRVAQLTVEQLLKKQFHESSEVSIIEFRVQFVYNESKRAGEILS